MSEENPAITITDQSITYISEIPNSREKNENKIHFILIMLLPAMDMELWATDAAGAG